MKSEQVVTNICASLQGNVDSQVFTQWRGMVFTQWLGVLLALITLLCLLPTPTAQAAGRGQIVCIDAGHGGFEPGNVKKDLKEKDLALEIAKNLEKKLNKANYSVVMTRTTDIALGNSERATICNNAGAAVLLSIHLNAPNDKDKKGNPIPIDPTVNYTSSIVGTGTEKKDKAFATTIVKAMDPLISGGAQNKIISQPNGILLAASMPATIAEAVFLSSDAEYDLFKNGKGKRQQQIAQTLFAGLEKWFVPKPAPTPTQPPVFNTCPIDPTIPGARFYEKSNYQGICSILGPGIYNDLAPFGLSGKIGSLTTYGSKYIVTLYDQNSLRGKSITFRTDTQMLSGNWNSRVRSMLIEEKSTNSTSAILGTWQGQGTYFQGQAPFQMILKVTEAQGNTFSGVLEEPTYSSAIGVKGTTSIKNGVTTIIFTGEQTLWGGQIVLHCTYRASIINGKMSGDWSYPNHASPDGTLTLSKTI